MGSTCTSEPGKALIPIYDFDQIRSGLAEDSLLVVDVREENEMIAPGRIPGTKHIPCKYVLSKFRQKVTLSNLNSVSSMQLYEM